MVESCEKGANQWIPRLRSYDFFLLVLPFIHCRSSPQLMEHLPLVLHTSAHVRQMLKYAQCERNMIHIGRLPWQQTKEDPSFMVAAYWGGGGHPREKSSQGLLALDWQPYLVMMFPVKKCPIFSFVTSRWVCVDSCCSKIFSKVWLSLHSGLFCCNLSWKRKSSICWKEQPTKQYPILFFPLICCKLVNRNELSKSLSAE